MSTLRNKVQLIGHLGADPEMKDFGNGKIKTTISVATKETYKDANGNKKEDTQWHNVISWGKTAENMNKYLKKGKEIAIEGKLTNRSYEAQDGTKKYITEVIANEFIMLDKKD